MAKKVPKRAREFSRPYRVTNGGKFRLKDVDPEDTAHLESNENAKEYLERGVAILADLQERLYAQDRWGVLLIFQAMDAAGKDGTIKHVMSGVNPQGVQVYSFKAPSLRGARPRLPVALHEGAARARADRDLQPLVLRGCARRARAPRAVGQDEAARVARHQGHLGGALRGHPRLRALPGAERLRGAEVLPARVARRAEAPLPVAARRAREELEVLDRRRRGARSLGRLHGARTRT